MTNTEKLFAAELNNWFKYEAGFKNSQFQMSIYKKCAPDGSKIAVLYCVDNYVYWYDMRKL